MKKEKLNFVINSLILVIKNITSIFIFTYIGVILGSFAVIKNVYWCWIFLFSIWLAYLLIVFSLFFIKNNRDYNLKIQNNKSLQKFQKKLKGLWKQSTIILVLLSIIYKFIDNTFYLNLFFFSSGALLIIFINFFMKLIKNELFNKENLFDAFYFSSMRNFIFNDEKDAVYFYIFLGSLLSIIFYLLNFSPI